MAEVKKPRGVPQELVIRKCRAGDESQILSLLRTTLVDSELYTEDYWRWMYRQNPLKSAIVWLAWDGEKLVGHYALVPLKMMVKGVLRTGATAVNIAIHPDYQGKGIFPKLVARAAEQASDEGIVVNYVFPNERSYRIFTRKLGWVKVGSLRSGIKFLDVERALSHRYRSKGLVKLLSYAARLFLGIFFRSYNYALPEGVNITRVPSFDERIDAFWERVAGSHNIITVRDREYLNWRFVTKPEFADYVIYLAERQKEILGYIVLKSVDSKDIKWGVVMDMLTLPGHNDIAGCLVSRAIHHSWEEGEETLHWFISKQNPYYKCFRRSGFVPLEEGSARLVAQTSTNEIPQSFVSDPKNWFNTIGGGNWL